MKANYESRSRTFLTRRTPVIIRLDGKAFHTYTKGLDKPFDEGLIEDMAETARFLCSEIQGAKLAYVQSDEISILLTDYDKLGTDAWFDYNVQKIVSISASLATAKFNQLRYIRSIKLGEEVDNYKAWKQVSVQTMAFFDSRAFNIPKRKCPTTSWQDRRTLLRTVWLCWPRACTHTRSLTRRTKVICKRCVSNRDRTGMTYIGRRKGEVPSSRTNIGTTSLLRWIRMSR